jgi:hypothetical protein
LFSQKVKTLEAKLNQQGQSSGNAAEGDTLGNHALGTEN